MLKKMFIILCAIMFALRISELSYAMMCKGRGQHQQRAQAESGRHKHTEREVAPETVSEEAVSVGNKICPVSGEEVGLGGMEPATYEYKGKIYHFCCTACIEEFKRDPEKYIKKVEEELEEEAKAESEETEADVETQMSPSMHEGHRH